VGKVAVVFFKTHFPLDEYVSQHSFVVLQIHPQSLCDDSSDDDLFKYGWVGVVQLEDPSVEPAACFSVLKKVLELFNVVND